MEKLQVTVTDETTKNLVVRLLHSIEGVQVKESQRSHKAEPGAALRTLAGIWKDRDISLSGIREKAWTRYLLFTHR